MKVVVICEDFRQDEFILRPIFDQIFREVGVKKVHISFSSPRLIQGVEEALNKSRLKEVFERHQEAHMFFLAVDRDGKPKREKRVQDRVAEARELGFKMLGCLAIEEAETWALALHRKELGDDWDRVIFRAIRAVEGME